MVPTYPAGLPLHMALAGMVAGWERGPFAIPPLASTGCLLLLFLLARRLGLAAGWALGAVLILAASPIFLLYSLQPMSDVPATFWTLMALWCASSAIEGDRRWLLAAGAAFAIGVWVRPTNILVAVPLAFALRWRASRIAIAVAAAIPFALGLMWWNASLYGSPIATGYGGATEVVDWLALRTCPPRYAGWLLDVGSALAFPAGLLVAFDRRAGGWTRVLLPVWFLTFFAFYSVYGVCDSWTYARFLLPALPALILGVMFVLRDLVALLSGVRAAAIGRAVAALLIGLMLWMEIRSGQERDVRKVREWESIYPRVIHATTPLLAPNAIVLSGLFSGSFLYYQNRWTVRWDELDNDQFQLLRAYAGNAGLKWYAVLSDVELKPEELPKRFDAKWRAIGRIQDVTIWELVPQ
jgi:4-amino-4-deoxy-L-arabinose transferase and related glycosyltransferases of PMT family